MMNYLWGGMLVIGVVYGALTGNMQAVTDSVLTSAKESVTLCITMLGIVAFWSGLMEVAVEAGVMESMTRMLKPFLHFLFPRIPPNHPALSAIGVNFVANILGLGWAATPAGLKAMKELAQLERERGNSDFMDIGTQDKGKGDTLCEGRAASHEMCTFLVMNISSLQLIPVNIIAYRSQYGSVNPAGILMPAIIATLISTAVAVVYCRIKAAATNMLNCCDNYGNKN